MDITFLTRLPRLPEKKPSDTKNRDLSSVLVFDCLDKNEEPDLFIDSQSISVRRHKTPDENDDNNSDSENSNDSESEDGDSGADSESDNNDRGGDNDERLDDSSHSKSYYSSEYE